VSTGFNRPPGAPSNVAAQLSATFRCAPRHRSDAADGIRNPTCLVHELEGPLPKVTNDQTSQALEALLAQIDQVTNNEALIALAEALQALARQLTEAQASLALEPLLRQIDKTTDDGARGGLTQALKALAGKLDKVQTNRAFGVALSGDRQDNRFFLLGAGTRGSGGAVD
jgi:hypothetical protein